MSRWKPFVGRFSVIRGLYSTGLVLYLGNRSIGFHPLRWLGGILVRQCARQQFRHIKVKGGTMNMVDRLARLPCKTCKGDTATELVKGVRDLGTCPDCQEEGKPMGLAFPQLTKPCPVDWGTHQKSCVCGGTGRVLKSDAECLLALLATAKHHVELGGRVSWYCVLTPRYRGVSEGEGNTPLEALATAVRKMYEADNPG